MSERRPPCPIQVTHASGRQARCSGNLEYRSAPERLVCDNCLRVWSLTELVILEAARCA